MWPFLAILILAVLFFGLRAIVRQAEVGEVPVSALSGKNPNSPESTDKFSLLIHLSESERCSFGKVDFKDQSEPQRVFSAIWDLDSQIGNGGLRQFFQNSDSDVVEYAPSALRAIDADVTARIVSDAVRIVAPIPQTQEDREAKVDSLSEEALGELSSLDAEVIAKPDDLTELLFAFVVRHPEEFGDIKQP